MIEVQVEPYCQNCADFEPEVIRLHFGVGVVMQTVVCTNRDRCAGLYEYIIKNQERN